MIRTGGHDQSLGLIGIFHTSQHIAVLRHNNAACRAGFHFLLGGLTERESAGRGGTVNRQQYCAVNIAIHNFGSGKTFRILVDLCDLQGGSIGVSCI